MTRHQRRAGAFHARQRVARRISQNNACSASAAINADDERCWVKRSGTHERFPCSVRGAVGTASDAGPVDAVTGVTIPSVAGRSLRDLAASLLASRPAARA